MTGDPKLADLQAKLTKLEDSLKGLLANTESELELASLIQKKLFKDRLPQIPGVRCYSRFISSYGVSAEGFEVFRTTTAVMFGSSVFGPKPLA